MNIILTPASRPVEHQKRRQHPAFSNRPALPAECPTSANPAPPYTPPTPPRHTPSTKPPTSHPQKQPQPSHAYATHHPTRQFSPLIQPPPRPPRMPRKQQPQSMSLQRPRRPRTPMNPLMTHITHMHQITRRMPPTIRKHPTMMKLQPLKNQTPNPPNLTHHRRPTTHTTPKPNRHIPPTTNHTNQHNTKPRNSEHTTKHTHKTHQKRAPTPDIYRGGGAPQGEGRRSLDGYNIMRCNGRHRPTSAEPTDLCSLWCLRSS